MKKVILFLSIVSFLLLTSHVYACTNETNEQAVTVTIDYVYYDADSHYYFANSFKDVDGGFWVLDIKQSDSLNANELNKLNQEYKNKKVKIVYTGNLDTDTDIEIVSSEIVTN
jgi:lipopolysaccharide export system protein LptA